MALQFLFSTHSLMMLYISKKNFMKTSFMVLELDMIPILKTTMEHNSVKGSRQLWFLIFAYHLTIPNIFTKFWKEYLIGFQSYEADSISILNLQRGIIL